MIFGKYRLVRMIERKEKTSRYLFILSLFTKLFVVKYKLGSQFLSRCFPPNPLSGCSRKVPLPLIGPLRLVGGCSCRLPVTKLSAPQLTLLAHKAPLVWTAGDEPLLPESGDNSLESPDDDDDDEADSDEDEDDSISNFSPSR
jgi:hypothetical protein